MAPNNFPAFPHGPGEPFMGPHAILIIQMAIVALALLILWWILRDHYRKERFNKNDTPTDILNKRYAAGQITKEEYERIKKDLAV